MSATATMPAQPHSLVRKSSMEAPGGLAASIGGGTVASAGASGRPPVGGDTKASAAAAGGGSILIGSKPTLLSVPPLRFLIMDAPRQSNLHLYIKECRKHSVTDVVRVCEPTYLPDELNQAGIGLHEMAYADGHSPPQEVLDRWLALVDEVFYTKRGAARHGPGGGGGKGGGGGGCC